MEKSFKRRIRNIDKHLKFFLTENENYFLGIPFEEYSKSKLLTKYNLPQNFPTQKFIIEPAPKGSVTKVNSNGKYGRKIPEEFEEVIRHIDYVRRKDQVRVKFDRRFRVYKKVLLHEFHSKISFVENLHGEKLVVSEQLKYNFNDSMKSTHIANIFNEIFNHFEVYDKDLNPAIHFNTTFDQIILPSGLLTETGFDELIEINKRFTQDEEKQQAFQKRLQLIMSYSPDLRGKGPNGFFGYLVFGFSDLDIVILENMYAGNATYIFKSDNINKDIINDKQSVLEQKLHEKRFFHNDNWEKLISLYMEKLGKRPIK
ncbi:hypothetical protein [Chryseobacterium sp. 5_R23647]|uniref:hypothetical protein n=1 Tax=Chryseobacterium sp. 5_R23647 TaxID=2258964 RepID=UPI000E265CBE|nr:hypothetical protein [Chryseobacterium sp. 5_R23647]REC44494.1 hypothetical protein DRF69_06135 [Chryseobacterium sp. 5_R23647]